MQAFIQKTLASLFQKMPLITGNTHKNTKAQSSDCTLHKIYLYIIPQLLLHKNHAESSCKHNHCCNGAYNCKRFVFLPVFYCLQ